MDRDKRWERVKEAYDLLVEGKGKQAADMVQAMQESYDEGVTDEFIKPINNSTVDGTIKEGDVVIFFNYRNDRAKELTVVLTQQDMPEQGMHTIPGLQFYCMTPYDASFKVFIFCSTRRMFKIHWVNTWLLTVRLNCTSQKQKSMLT